MVDNSSPWNCSPRLRRTMVMIRWQNLRWDTKNRRSPQFEGGRKCHYLYRVAFNV